MAWYGDTLLRYGLRAGRVITMWQCFVRGFYNKLKELSRATDDTINKKNTIIISIEFA